MTDQQPSNFGNDPMDTTTLGTTSATTGESYDDSNELSTQQSASQQLDPRGFAQKTIETVKELPDAFTPGHDKRAVATTDGQPAAQKDPSGW